MKPKSMSMTDNALFMALFLFELCDNQKTPRLNALVLVFMGD
jgi:hypothetical protein